MVRVTTLLCRVPVIKFRKGGGGGGHAPSAPAPAASAFKPGSCALGAAAGAAKKTVEPKMLGKLSIPKGVLISGKTGKEAVTLNIVLQRAASDNIGGNRKR